MTEPEDDLVSAVEALYAEKGSGYCFPTDYLWQSIDPSSLGMTPHAASAYLKREGYIVATGATTGAVSRQRKGAPTTEYTFGPQIDVNSLPMAQAARGGGLSTVSSQPIGHETATEENPIGVFPLGFPLQRIVHGCPGTGKSYLLADEARAAHFVIRTVFFQETSYHDFVGGLKPQSIYRVDKNPPEFIGSTIEVPGEPVIQYVVQPGPFLKAYRLACTNPGKSIVLIIEELSRAVAAHVFGDILQLLDRHEDGLLAGFSRYPIDARPDIESWLLLNDVANAETALGKLSLPPNLYIWATMNRADQNARQLDSAFLRRWSKVYLSYLDPGTNDHVTVKYGGREVSWGDLRTAVNMRLIDLGGVPEDKFIGPYMISPAKLSDPNEVLEELWGYLWNDVLKTRASQFFDGVATFADLRVRWKSGDGVVIGEIGGP
jgi:5-methylcytosine-specific restriction protein B